MSARLSLLFVAAALPWVSSLSPSAATAQTTRPPALGVDVTTCRTGLAKSERLAVFTASMPAIPKGVTMAMRFDLEERLGTSGRFVRLPAPNFGRWERSEPNVAGFAYTKRLQGLRAPAAYRVKVQFRWLDADGERVRTARRVSSVCGQPDERPDLQVSRLRIAEGDDGVALYSVTVRNAGRSDVESPFLIGLGIAGVPQRAQEVGALSQGAKVTFVFRAPRCAAGAAVVARVDGGRAVDEADERNNTRRKTCPAA